MMIKLDCTLRDGGYINNWRFNNIFIESYIETMNNIKMDFVEIGFINKTNNYKNELVGPIRNLDFQQIGRFQNNFFKIAVMADFTDINLDLLEQNINVDLVRIAFHKNDLANALLMCKKVKDLGYKVSVNAMAITNYDNDDLELLINFINDNKLDILYIADSYGSLTQKQIQYYIEFFCEKLVDASVGLHLHNNMNNAFGNFEYLTNLNNKSQKDIFIDSTLFGMGRGAGNLQTELVIINRDPNIEFPVLIQLLTFIQTFIKPIYKFDENMWSYDLDYLLSGFFKMHPNYVIKMRDLNINMINRFFLIKIINDKHNSSFFDKNIIRDLIEQYKQILL